MKLRIHALNPTPPPIVAARRARAWMDRFPGRHPYRCVPLTIANSHGWEILSPHAFAIHWNGGPAASDVTFEPESRAPYLDHFVNAASRTGS